MSAWISLLSRRVMGSKVSRLVGVLRSCLGRHTKVFARSLVLVHGIHLRSCSLLPELVKVRYFLSIFHILHLNLEFQTAITTVPSSTRRSTALVVAQMTRMRQPI